MLQWSFRGEDKFLGNEAMDVMRMCRLFDEGNMFYIKELGRFIKDKELFISLLEDGIE